MNKRMPLSCQSGRDSNPSHWAATGRWGAFGRAFPERPRDELRLWGGEFERRTALAAAARAASFFSLRASEKGISNHLAVDKI